MNSTRPNPAEFARFEQAARRLRPGCRLLSAVPLSGGISASMTRLEIEVASGEREAVILRRPPSGAEGEFRVLEAVSAAGIPASRPLALDTSGEIFPEPYLLLDYVAGEADLSRGFGEAQARQAAQALARIHQVSGGQPGLAFLPEVAARYTAMLDRPPAEPALDPDGSVRAALRGCSPFPEVEPSLLHGDFWPGNWLWCEGRLAAVIDWEDAARGDPLADLAGARLDLWWIFSPEVAEAFTRFYRAASGRSLEQLPGWDLYAALRLARMVGDDLTGWAAFFEPYGRGDITPESIRAGFEGFVAQARAKLQGKGL